MKEFKLIPLNEFDISAAETQSKPTPLKNMDDALKVGNEDFNAIMKNLF